MTEKDRLMPEELMNNTNEEELTRHAKVACELFLAYKKQGFTPTQILELVKQLIDTTLRMNMLIQYDSRMKQPPQ
jgi:hypothetical protein